MSKPAPSLPSRRTPAPSPRPQPQPQQPAGVKGGVKTRPSQPTVRPTVTTKRVQPTTSAPAISEEEEEENEISGPTTARPATPISPVRKMLPGRSQQPTGTKTGTKTKQAPAKISPRPVGPTTQRATIQTTTTSRPLIDEEDEGELRFLKVLKISNHLNFESFEHSLELIDNCSLISFTDNEAPAVTTAAPRKISPTTRPAVTSRPLQPSTRPAPSLPTGGVKRPSQPGTKTVPSKTQPRRPAPTTTSRPTTSSEEEEGEDETLPPARPAPKVVTQRYSCLNDSS